MGKPFLEVFPSLKLPDGIQDIMEEADVERISATKRKDMLRIYLHSTNLIAKADIRNTEQQIKKQLFANANMTVKIYERFELSAQYSAEKLMGIYKDSILEELKEYSHIEYNAFKTADISYPQKEQILLIIDDTVLNRSKEAELLRILEKIFVERCGLLVTVRIEYKAARTGKYEEEDERKLRQKVAEIYNRVKGDEESAGWDRTEDGNMQNAAPVSQDKVGAATNPAKTAGMAKPENSTKSISPGKSGKSGTFTKNGKAGEFRRGGESFSRFIGSDTPYVIYASDFE